MLLLDTSVAVELREGQELVVDRLGQVPTRPVLSIISVIELENGIDSALEGRATRRTRLDILYGSFDILEFGTKEAAAYRDIVASLGFSRRNTFDRMIAAQAIVARAILATLNPRDFRGIAGLTIEDWSA